MDTVLQLTAPAELSLTTVLVNLLIAAALTFLLSWHFVRFGSTLSNRRKFAAVLPAIGLTTMFVITIVKASLALSLGLVGALSIVRFRTPVKEPEELAYLFVAIAIGLALGADHRLIGFASISLILAIMSVRSLFARRPQYPNMYLNIDAPSNGPHRVVLTELVDLLGRHAANVDLRRYDVTDTEFAGTFYLECKSVDELASVQDAIRERYPAAAVTFVDQSTVPGA